MKYLSVCSGIEAASVAWHPMGWEPLAFSEIEPFPRAVLAHHYPDVPCHGDFTKLRDQPWIVDADVLVGGTPCQAFSVAGLRKSLDDDRGNLSLEFVRLADAIDAVRREAGRPDSVIVWENVPGVLSVKDNAFGCFLAGLAGDVTPYVPPRGKWTNAGVVDGPQRSVAWRVLDAQYFGLAQRRRRVFVVASARDGFDPAAVLLEFEGVRRDTPPRREKGQAASGGATGRAAGGGLGTDFDCDGGVIRAVAMEDPVPPLMARSSRGGAQTLSPGHQTDGHMVAVEQPYTVANCLTARMHKGINTTLDEGQTPIVTHSLRAEGFDASEDGTGRGTPLVPVAYPINTQIALRHNALGERTGMGIGDETDPAFTLQAGHSHAVAYRTTGNDGVYESGDLVAALTTATDPNSHVIAFSSKDHGADATEDLSPTLRAMPHNTSHANGGGQMAVAFAQNTRDEVREMPYVGALAAEPGMKQTSYVRQNMAVRRLTPTECERLQGFPDGYTMIPWKKKPAEDCPDGPRYKALGNSMAVPVMRWIGKRIGEELA